MKVQITLRLDKEIKDRLEAMARAEKRSLNQWLNFRIERLMEESPDAEILGGN